jgi:hypothetical protein
MPKSRKTSVPSLSIAELQRMLRVAKAEQAPEEDESEESAQESPEVSDDDSDGALEPAHPAKKRPSQALVSNAEPVAKKRAACSEGTPQPVHNQVAAAETVMSAVELKQYWSRLGTAGKGNVIEVMRKIVLDFLDNNPKMKALAENGEPYTSHSRLDLTDSRRLWDSILNECPGLPKSVMRTKLSEIYTRMYVDDAIASYLCTHICVTK